MLIGTKGKAVISIDEYDRLKKIEDKYNDNIESIRKSFEDKFDYYITQLSEDSNYKVVIFKMNKEGTSPFYISKRMTTKEYKKLLSIKKAELVATLTKEESTGLYREVFGKPFKQT